MMIVTHHLLGFVFRLSEPTFPFSLHRHRPAQILSRSLAYGRRALIGKKAALIHSTKLHLRLNHQHHTVHSTVHKSDLDTQHLTDTASRTACYTKYTMYRRIISSFSGPDDNKKNPTRWNEKIHNMSVDNVDFTVAKLHMYGIERANTAFKK
jgi:hypothetical protein